MGSGFVIGEVEVVNEVSLAPSAVLYDGAVSADGELSVRVNTFYYDLGGAHGRYLGSVGNPVTDNAQNFVYLDNAAALQVTTAGYPAGMHIRLARVYAQGGIIVRVILERAFFTSGGSAVALSSKSGVLVPGDFAGSPKTAAVAFTSAYPSTNYAVTLSVNTDGTKSFAASIESKSLSGFVVNLQSNNVANLIEVGWHTLLNGS